MGKAGAKKTKKEGVRIMESKNKEGGNKGKEQEEKQIMQRQRNKAKKEAKKAKATNEEQ